MGQTRVTWIGFVLKLSGAIIEEGSPPARYYCYTVLVVGCCP